MWEWLLRHAYGEGGQALSGDELGKLRQQIFRRVGSGISQSAQQGGDVWSAIGAGVEGIHDAKDRFRDRIEAEDTWESGMYRAAQPHFLEWLREQIRRQSKDETGRGYSRGGRYNF